MTLESKPRLQRYAPVQKKRIAVFLVERHKNGYQSLANVIRYTVPNTAIKLTKKKY